MSLPVSGTSPSSQAKTIAPPAATTEVEALAQPGRSSPYRAPIHSELVVANEATVVAPARAAIGAVIKACAIALVTRGAVVGVLWLYSVRTGSALLSSRWAMPVSAMPVLWWATSAARAAKARGVWSVRSALLKELVVLSSGIALIECLPWSSRWFVELWGTFLIVAIATLLLLGRGAQKRPSMWEDSDGRE
ncbi:MAG: hypothetical protein U0269_20865 [Polyangiales bacterium]